MTTTPSPATPPVPDEPLDTRVHGGTTMGDLQRHIGRLTADLRTRDVLGQAKGILMTHYAIGDQEASGVLTRLADETNLRSDVLAMEIVSRMRDRFRASPEHRRAVGVCLEEILADARRASGSSRGHPGRPHRPDAA